MGQANGGPAVDYTVNCALGVPNMTGPASLGDEPVNHVLPAWDLITGAYTAFAILAAERHRRETGQGSDVRIPLTDIGISSLANMGQVAEVLYTDKRLIVMAISPRQWKGLVQVLDIAAQVAAIETQRGVSFDKDEGVRFEHRDVLYPLVQEKISQWSEQKLGAALDEVGGCWGAYKTLHDAVTNSDLVQGNPIFETIENPSGFTYPTAGSAATMPAQTRQSPRPAPLLGQNTEEVLAEFLGMNSREIAALHDSGTIKTKA